MLIVSDAYGNVGRTASTTMILARSCFFSACRSIPSASSPGWAATGSSKSQADDTDYYSINVDATGVTLHIATSTPAGGPQRVRQQPLPRTPALRDENGNLVAIASGNATDGRNSVMDFTIPDGDSGAWSVQVAPHRRVPRRRTIRRILVSRSPGARWPWPRSL